MYSLCIVTAVFEIPRVPFAFEFQTERPNGNSVTKKLPNCHLVIREKSV